MACGTRRSKAAELQGRAQLIRYADDLVVVCKREDDARKVMDVLPKRFGRFGPTLHPDKTRLVRFVRPACRRPRAGRFRRGASPRPARARVSRTSPAPRCTSTRSPTRWPPCPEAKERARDRSFLLRGTAFRRRKLSTGERETESV